MRWNDVNRFALKPAIADINQTSRLTLTATPHKVGRTVTGITIAWAEKEPDRKRDTKRELDRPKTGRRARRDGTEETLALAFPEHGTVRDTQPWDRIARTAAPKLDGGHVPDLRKLADAFRKWCSEKTIRLDATAIEKTFTTWCKSYSAR